MTDAEINRILFCDETEFLEDDVTQMEASSNTEDINVVIDPPNDAVIPVDNIGESSDIYVPQSSEVPTR